PVSGTKRDYHNPQIKPTRNTHRTRLIIQSSNNNRNPKIGKLRETVNRLRIKSKSDKITKPIINHHATTIPILQSVTIPSIQGIHKTQTRRKPSYT
ncbi:hypothetical protein LINGRAHAP2_LOCUS9264, partial [Linum grandiflorum]